MSADNWAVCPRCLRRARARHESEERRVQALYGQIPVEEFDAERASLKPVNEDEYRTFREDYEFWVTADTGEWFASYSGECSTCHLAHQFTREEPIKGWDE